MSNPIQLDIPWKVIAASPDMMDMTFGSGKYPFVWRSSMAISVFEPSDDLPDGLCGQTITFIKVACSITGYQPMESEGSGSDVPFPDVPVEELAQLATEYWGCYGALLNVSVFPSGVGATLDNLPNIIDFQPKSRELLRAVTSGGEVLDSSTSNLTLDNSLTTTKKNETSASVTGGFQIGTSGSGGGGGNSGSTTPPAGSTPPATGSTTVSPDDSGPKLGFSVEGKLEHTWGTTTEQKSQVTSTSGDESHATTNYSTSVDHLYSLLTGYHVGTNRVAFFLLPRPFTEQPTDRLSFAPGLRMLEGVQEFVLVVSRRADVGGLCIEATLNTAHFPANVNYEEEQPQPSDLRLDEFEVKKTLPGTSIRFSADTVPLESLPISNYRALEGWVIDAGQRDADGNLKTDSVTGLLLSPVELVADNSTSNLSRDLDGYQVRVVDQKTVRIFGTLKEETGYNPSSVVFDRRYRVHLISQRVANSSPSLRLITPMLSTGRNLKVCYVAEGGCPTLLPILTSPPIVVPAGTLVQESQFQVALPSQSSSLVSGSRREHFSKQIQSTLTVHASGGELAPPPIRFSDTDYFNNHILATVGKSWRDALIHSLPALPEKFRSMQALVKIKAAEVMDSHISLVQAKLKLSLEDAILLRRVILSYALTASPVAK